jgi:influenza virus NS1A-binding protein
MSFSFVLPSVCNTSCANVAGGYDRAECLKCVELYDPDTNLWDTLSSMKEARGRFDIAVVKGKVYAIGGSNGTTELATVEMYDPQEKKWTRITPLPLARCNIGKCSVFQLPVLMCMSRN